jgi:adenine-specific DNA-methyltransferase
MSLEVKQKIAAALSEFQINNLFDSGINLFRALGYNTERQQKLEKSNYKSFKESFVEGNNKLFNEKKALTQRWKQVHLLFQLTKAELLNQGILFDTKKVDNKIIEAYLFFAIELDSSEYTRTHLSEITREINKLFPMPVMVLFKINGRLTLSVINRRLHKKDENKDVLEKITLIKDIDIANPHRGHIEILFDLGFQELYNNHQFDSFVSLHTAWQKTLDANELNKKFYQELANWYFWAIEKVEFPNDIKFNKNKDKDRQIRNSTNVIRLITRLIFTWFLKEKNLVPDELFDEKKLKQIINFEDKTGSTYYKAILQNLFFATLNTPMNADQSGSRKFIKDQHLIHTLFRYERFFKNKKIALELFENIPFLNGGLFECLDKKTDSDDIVRLDCFSDNPKNEKRLVVPDELFFSDYQPLDLNTIYQTKNRKYKVRGLVNILNAYKFTIHENTPIEEEVALDPELLGKVFENLLASYNPETETTARKQTGSFYTPREIVNYMVDESLLAYIANFLINKITNVDKEQIESNLKKLLSYTEEPTGFSALQNKLIVEAIFHIKILDPACGSGAFPMGVLHKLVYILGKIDKDNTYWRELQKQKAIRETEDAFNIGNKQEREERLKDISETFENNNGDYGRKLYLIENSIYGVDIQPIAVQIAKLRFFISLIVDQRINTKVENIGVRPLPNLETKFVAANTLIGIERPAQQSLRNPLIDIKEKELKQIREKHFTARTPKTKEKYRILDAKLRNEIAELLNKDGFGSKTTEMLSNWNPYDQNTFADFFDTEWMFNFSEGFDLVIGNPPYVSYYSNTGSQLTDKERQYFVQNYKSVIKANDRINSMNLMTERGLNLLNKNGHLSFITNKTIAVLPSYTQVRKYITSSSKIEYIVSDLDPFDAIVDCVVFGLKKIKPEPSYNIKWLKGQIDDFKIKKFDVILSNTNLEFIFSENSSLLEKIESNSTRLDNYIEINRGVNIGGCFEYFLSSEKETVNHRKYLSGTRNVQKYFYDWYPEDGYMLFDLELEKKLRNNGKTLVLGNPERYNVDRLIIPESGQTLIAAYSNEAVYTAYGLMIGTLITNKTNLKFICALLNSNLLNFYAIEKEILRKGNKATPHVGVKGLNMLPIKVSSNKAFTKICDYVAISKQVGNLLIASFFENLLDGMVYELYFPQEVASANCNIVKHLSSLEEIQEGWSIKKKTEIIDREYTKLNMDNEPVRKALYFMDTIEEIAIIKGKKS